MVYRSTHADMKSLIIASILAVTYYGHVENRHGRFGRIGILYNPGDHAIVEVYKGSPAAKAGLKRGDTVVHVNDKDITGPAYTLVNLSILKKDGQMVTVVIERVPAELIDIDHPLPHENKHKT